MSHATIEDLIEEGKRLEIPSYNDHLKFYCDQMLAGEAWERKARELIDAEIVHYPQLEALSNQVQVNALPVSRETRIASTASPWWLARSTMSSSLNGP